jgi:hypothetical protein
MHEMVKRKLSLILLFVFSTFWILNAQESKVVILNLKTGYSVKGEIVEQTEQGVKIKTSDGQIFEYSADEIINTTDAKPSLSGKQLFTQKKEVSLTIAKGDILLGAGIGFFGLTLGNNFDKIAMPPIPLTFEYVIEDNLLEGRGALGLGGYLGYSATKQDYYFEAKNSTLIIGARGYFHYALVNKLDTYGGVLLGYRNENTSYTGNENSHNDYKEGSATANIFVGSRYFFNEKIAGMAELGWGLSMFTLGVTLRL